MGLLVGTLIHGQERVEEPLREAILQVGRWPTTARGLQQLVHSWWYPVPDLCRPASLLLVHCRRWRQWQQMMQGGWRCTKPVACRSSSSSWMTARQPWCACRCWSTADQDVVHAASRLLPVVRSRYVTATVWCAAVEHAVCDRAGGAAGTCRAAQDSNPGRWRSACVGPPPEGR